MVQTEIQQEIAAEQTTRQETGTAATARWSDAELRAARYRADPEVDQLAAEVLDSKEDDPTVGRRAYNHLLDIADKLLEDPELALVQSSSVVQQRRDYPPQLVNYFDPMEAPAWIDAAKLDRASQLWQENMLAMLGVLYAASLPSCYLMRNGIPALYESSKLREHRYIYQRIYETGRFLDDVMSPGGMQVITDLGTCGIGPEHLCTALNSLDPDGAWTQVGQDLVRTQTGTQPLDPQQVTATARRLCPPAKQYIWGKGYVAAKKVRFLHATMRFMLTHPHAMASFGKPQGNPATVAESLGQPVMPWYEAARGKPVNQEDLAYTLLTFAYLIPHGLEKWGCIWTLEDKEAFLHLWKTVGYILGVEATFLTDSWDEAAQLFNRIRQQQASASKDGKRLTDALMQFLQDYLPPLLARHVPALLIQRQLGTYYAAMLLAPEQLHASRSVMARAAFGVFLGLVRLYFLVRNVIFRRSATIAAFMGSVSAQVGEALIDSWRDVYARRAFYVPANASTWKRIQGVRDGFMVQLHAWRTKLFTTIAAGLGFLGGATCCLVVAFALLLFGYNKNAEMAAWLALGCFLTALGILTVSVPHVTRKRPQIHD